MRRRKLRIDFIDDAAMRMRLSVDFSVPEDVAATARDAQGREFVHLPLFVLRKAPQELLDFDLSDAAGRALSLPTRASNAELSHEALRTRAEAILGAAVSEASLTQSMREVAELDPPQSLDICDQLLANPGGGSQRAQVAADDDFCFLAGLVAWSSIVAMPVPMESGEQLLKLVYSEPITEWKSAFGARVQAGVRPLPAWVDIPFTGAQSFHLEVHPPPGMSVAEGTFSAITPQGVTHQHGKGLGRAMHLYASKLSKGRSGGAFLRLRPQRRGMITNAQVACMAVVVVLLASASFAAQFAQANTTVPTLLLFLPALLATLALQPSDHALTGRFLRLVRIAIATCAAMAYLAAGWLVVAPEKNAPKVKGTVVIARSSEAPANSSAAAKRPKQRSGGGQAKTSGGRRAVAVELSGGEKPDPRWLRIGWLVLAIPALGASVLVDRARRYAA